MRAPVVCVRVHAALVRVIILRVHVHVHAHVHVHFHMHAHVQEEPLWTVMHLDGLEGLTKKFEVKEADEKVSMPICPWAYASHDDD